MWKRRRESQFNTSVVVALLICLPVAAGWSISTQLEATTRPLQSATKLRLKDSSIAFQPFAQDRRRSTSASAAASSGRYPWTTLRQSSFTADGSEYSSFDKSSSDDDDTKSDSYDRGGTAAAVDQDETPTIELQPIPLSKNAGNRFVAIVWDRDFYNDDGLDVWDWHYNRIALTEDHVMFCRKSNLYNETFNTESMVDVLWSLPILASDLKRVIGQAMCLESTQLDYVEELLENEPIIQMLRQHSGKGEVQLYRWRHIRDYSLRMDDGRNGYPCMCLALDENNDGSLKIRDLAWNEQLEYWIRSERVIATGPLHKATAQKDDVASIPVGDLTLFNAPDREAAIKFAENLPLAQRGLYKDLRVHFYNTLDVTGKFVSEDPLRDSPCEQMKEAMDVWGYPVADDQTPWLNW